MLTFAPTINQQQQQQAGFGAAPPPVLFATIAPPTASFGAGEGVASNTIAFSTSIGGAPLMTAQLPATQQVTFLQPNSSGEVPTFFHL